MALTAATAAALSACSATPGTTTVADSHGTTMMACTQTSLDFRNLSGRASLLPPASRNACTGPAMVAAVSQISS